ncbi:MAG: sugar transferase [Clostridia bacterium]|nr:sugar transferase [Clostridia bacterium]
MNINNMDVLSVERIDSSESIYNRLTKRSFDILMASIGISILIPIAAIIAVIYLFIPGQSNIFFVQQRIGKNGKLFKMYKFQTMIDNADDELIKFLSENEEARQEYKIKKKLTNDPRITIVGKFLRRTSIDEFPQFINILKGEMSIVGPRPYLPREIDDMGTYYDYIIKCKPGLTGMWQISGRNDISFENRLKIDYKYVQNNSIRNDAKIVFKTIENTLIGRGAL